MKPEIIPAGRLTKTAIAIAGSSVNSFTSTNSYKSQQINTMSGPPTMTVRVAQPQPDRIDQPVGFMG